MVSVWKQNENHVHWKKIWLGFWGFGLSSLLVRYINGTLKISKKCFLVLKRLNNCAEEYSVWKNYDLLYLQKLSNFSGTGAPEEDRPITAGCFLIGQVGSNCFKVFNVCMVKP